MKEAAAAAYMLKTTLVSYLEQTCTTTGILMTQEMVDRDIFRKYLDNKEWNTL